MNVVNRGRWVFSQILRGRLFTFIALLLAEQVILFRRSEPVGESRDANWLTMLRHTKRQQARRVTDQFHLDRSIIVHVANEVPSLRETGPRTRLQGANEGLAVDEN